MPKVVFVILHYLAIDDTVECVESILNNVNYSNYEIVIVDNASDNGSKEYFDSKFTLYKDIHIIYNEKNLGFAKGNNIGYEYAKKINAEFIVIINNDTLISDSNFINNIIEYYEKNNFHVLGPKIISTKDEYNQNPLKNVMKSKKDIIRNIIIYSILYILNILKIESLYKKIKLLNDKKSVNGYLSRRSEEKILYDVPLHGACLIFSKKYIESQDYAFYPNTFLFVEEDILYYICKKRRYKMIYFPDSCILHKEDSSTDLLMNTEERKRRFIYKNILKSTIEFLKLSLKKNI